MIKSTSSWDVEFFEEFISISNSNYLGHPDYIKESLDTFEKMFREDAPFNCQNDWKAWIYKDGDSVKGRIFASTRTDELKQNKFLPVGYFEADSQDIANMLFKEVKEFATEHKYTLIKGPIQGNVFNSSRFITKQTHKRLFLGEPLHKKEYLQYFERAGFELSQHWVSGFFGLKGRLTGMYDYLTKYKKSPYRKKNYKIRHIDMNNWDSELELFYSLMMDSFSEMKDVELISFEEFKVWNESLKHIINPKKCLILEHENEPLGFLLGIRDRRRDIARISKKDNLFSKLHFAYNHKANNGLLLMNYLGKKKGAEGVVKGVGVKLFTKMAKLNNGFLFTPTIFGFMSDDSKTLEMVPKVYDISSEYCMFEMTLSD